MSERSTLLDEWNDYVTDAMPSRCSEEQMIETRRAFYAGAMAYQTLLLLGWTNREDMLKRLQALNRELKVWLGSLKYEAEELKRKGGE